MIIPSLRRAAGVTEAVMEEVYQELRAMTVDDLKKMFELTDPWKPERGLGWSPTNALIRHQIAFTIERKLSGRW